MGYYYDATGYHGFLDVGGVFTPIDVPGASFINASGINNSGNIVGYYSDATGDHGFLDMGGVFTSIDVPGAFSSTRAIGINDSGNIVGYYSDAVGMTHGFVATTSSVPEPATLFLLGFGLVGMIALSIKFNT